jgi:ribose/xylose/arabinose/galactoside ABC-type transport system permease subunit
MMFMLGGGSVRPFGRRDGFDDWRDRGLADEECRMACAGGGRCGLAVAAAGGFLNGFVVARVRVNALITTLGTMGVFQGIALLIGGPGITFLPESFTKFGQSEVLGVQAPVL